MSKRRLKSEVIERLIGIPGLRARVDAHCVSCIYDETEEGTWRQQVQACVVYSCPIWDVRSQTRARDLPASCGGQGMPTGADKPIASDKVRMAGKETADE